MEENAALNDVLLVEEERRPRRESTEYLEASEGLGSAAMLGGGKQRKSRPSKHSKSQV